MPAATSVRLVQAVQRCSAHAMISLKDSWWLNSLQALDGLQAIVPKHDHIPVGRAQVDTDGWSITHHFDNLCL